MGPVKIFNRAVVLFIMVSFLLADNVYALRLPVHGAERTKGVLGTINPFEAIKAIDKFTAYLQQPSFKGKQIFLVSDSKGNLNLRMGRRIIYKLIELPGIKDTANEIRDIISSAKGDYTWTMEISKGTNKEDLKDILLKTAGLAEIDTARLIFDNIPLDEKIDNGIRVKSFIDIVEWKDVDHFVSQEACSISLNKDGGLSVVLDFAINGNYDQDAISLVWNKKKQLFSVETILARETFETETSTIEITGVKENPFLNIISDIEKTEGAVNILLRNEITQQLHEKGFRHYFGGFAGRRGWRIATSSMSALKLDVIDDHFQDLIENSLKVSTNELKLIEARYKSEMTDGLSGRKSSLQIIPAYVPAPTGQEKGEYYALDIGGSNLRVLRVRLEGDGKYTVVGSKTFAFRDEHKQGNADGLFGFIGECVEEFLTEQGVNKDTRIVAGLTWSFPVKQTGIASGIHKFWTKGWNTKGVEGGDPVQLLYSAFGRNETLKDFDINIAALCNDTVGTFAAGRYVDPDCMEGVILGTGTNASYPESMSNILKWEEADEVIKEMCINQEWGAFDKIILSNWDRILDKESKNPGAQILEKQVSGMYLGEITRLILKDLIAENMLFNKKSSPAFLDKEDENDPKKGFKTEYLSRICSDSTSNLTDVDLLLQELGISNSTIAHRQLVKHICQLVAMRSTRLSAAIMLATITKNDPELKLRDSYAIAIDGSLYERFPFFKEQIDIAFKEILGEKAAKIRTFLTKDGSGIGAAILASVADRMRNEVISKKSTGSNL